MNSKRHQGDSKTFEELNFKEQSLSMNMTALNFRRQLQAHLRRAEKEDRNLTAVLRKRLSLLQSILSDLTQP